MTSEDLRELQNLPLDQKVLLTKERVYDWIDHFGEDGVYVSFSGGKDSTVLLDMVRRVSANVPAVFFNTGLEYPEVRRFAKSFDNVITVYPKMTFAEVISKYGYPIISKEISQAVYECRAGLRNNDGTYQYRIDQFDDVGKYAPRNGKRNRYSYAKYKPLISTDFNISHMCCMALKKRPAKSYERKSKRHPILGLMAIESQTRRQRWLKYGCNGFEEKRQTSCPMSFWTEQDVLEYISKNGIEIASVYGNVEFDGCRYCTSGCERTGCTMCAFGAHFDKGETRFQRLKRTHPKQYEYCMRGGQHDPNDGLWKPNEEGLGMQYVFDTLNGIYGPQFIQY